MVMEVANARTQDQILCILQETYGKETVIKWGIAIMDALQQTEILRQRMYESGVSGKTEEGKKLDDRTLPCPELIAEWIMRDMWEHEKCGCSPQGRKPREQRDKQLAEVVSELSHKSTPKTEDLFDMWSNGEGIGLLQQALYQIQKIWKSSMENGKGGDGMNDVSEMIVRRLTPL